MLNPCPHGMMILGTAQRPSPTITPPLEGESQKPSRRLTRCPHHHSPLEGESQKPSRQAPADAVGGRS
ncbi:MAG: hypothetical protein F4201_08780 [Nitrospira sp. SB0677_bin_15]|nr:hypothetical protein [Nitrospira sp. SB0677_bin_15]